MTSVGTPVQSAHLRVLIARSLRVVQGDLHDLVASGSSCSDPAMLKPTVRRTLYTTQTNLYSHRRHSMRKYVTCCGNNTLWRVLTRTSYVQQLCVQIYSYNFDSVGRLQHLGFRCLKQKTLFRTRPRGYQTSMACCCEPPKPCAAGLMRRTGARDKLGVPAAFPADHDLRHLLGGCRFEAGPGRGFGRGPPWRVSTDMRIA